MNLANGFYKSTKRDKKELVTKFVETTFITIFL